MSAVCPVDDVVGIAPTVRSAASGWVQPWSRMINALRIARRDAAGAAADVEHPRIRRS